MVLLLSVWCVQCRHTAKSLGDDFAVFVRFLLLTKPVGRNRVVRTERGKGVQRVLRRQIHLEKFQVRLRATFFGKSYDADLP